MSETKGIGTTTGLALAPFTGGASIPIGAALDLASLIVTGIGGQMAGAEERQIANREFGLKKDAYVTDEARKKREEERRRALAAALAGRF